ncbi:MAG: hypothetical protein P8163_21245 [Candidatus Thiodiazotropha sp.]
MNQGGRIYIRQESLRRLLWEKYENWRWQRAENAMGRAFAHYDFDKQLESALDRMVEKELNVVLLHEKGEHQAGQVVGDGWNKMVLDLGHSAAELMVRAVRDHWADCQVTLPQLLKDRDEASLHFYIGGMTGMRKSLFPELMKSYEKWYQDKNWQRFDQLVAEGQAHWSELAVRLLDCYQSRPADSQTAIKLMVEENIL